MRQTLQAVSMHRPVKSSCPPPQGGQSPGSEPRGPSPQCRGGSTFPVLQGLGPSLWGQESKPSPVSQGRTVPKGLRTPLGLKEVGPSSKGPAGGGPPHLSQL